MELNELKQKYASVLQAIKKRGVVLSHLHLQDGKLFLQGAAPTQAIKNQIWDEIKAVDASYADVTADLSVDTSLPEPPPEEVIYTVQPGDSLWKIAAKMLAGGQHYPRIIAANPGKLKDEHTVIHPGDQLRIPPA